MNIFTLLLYTRITQELHKSYTPLTSIILIRNTHLPGYCYRSEEEIIKDVLLWTENHGTTKIGRQRKLM